MNTEYDNEIMQFLARHLPDETQMIYVGPDHGAHYPVFFSSPSNLPVLYPQIKKSVQIIRTTAALYMNTHRVTEQTEKVWCVACDFDFDRGEWEQVDRATQEATLYETCAIIPPTFITQTRNGYHLFWVLQQPESVFDYPYVASIIKDTLKADPHSVVPTHCLSFSNRGRKPAHLTPLMVLNAIGKTMELHPCPEHIYTTNMLTSMLKTNVSPKVINLYKLYNQTLTGGITHQKQAPSVQMLQKRMEIDSLLEQYDITEVLKAAGYFAYNRGRYKVITICPYHYDRHPSAFINLDPNSDYYGQFNCSSCQTTKQLKTLLRDIGLDV